MVARPPMLMPAEAYALWAASYPARAHNPVMQAEERAMLALMPDTLQGEAVLDVGCGSGRYMLHALRRSAARVIGVDLSPQMLARAGTELAALRTAADIDLVQGSLAALPVPDARANLTICGLVGIERSQIRAVVRHGVPRIADPDFAEWFEVAGMETVAVTLDGKPKLLAKPLADAALVALEPGLELVAAHRARDLIMEAG